MSNQPTPARALPFGPGLASARDRGPSSGRGVGVGFHGVDDKPKEASSCVHGGIGADGSISAQGLNIGARERANIKQLWELALEERALSKHDRGAGVVVFEDGRFVAYRQSERVGEFASAEEAQGALEAA